MSRHSPRSPSAGNPSRSRSPEDSPRSLSLSKGAFAAIDLGATSGRVMLGRVGPDQLSVETVHRFPNEPVRTPDGLHWNILELYRNVLVGLGKAIEAEPELMSIGIDSWAVDYGLLRGRSMLNNPFHYRDDRTAAGVDAVHDLVAPEELYRIAGLQFLPFNTVYQLAVDQASGVLDAADSMLMVPDLIAFWLTGVKVAEVTNASTTGLLSATDMAWDGPLLDRLGLPRRLFADLVPPGTTIGSLLPVVRDQIGAPGDISVVAVGSHDTASAVVAVPMLTEDAAYISSGTWSLVGVELGAPVLSEASRAANFTNEGGVDGRVRYLHNIMGLWLLSESVHTWKHEGAVVDLDTLLAEAADIDGSGGVFDANDPRLLAPGDLPARIAELAAANGRPPAGSHAELVRWILQSLASAYAEAIEQVELLSGRAISTVHIVGGGSLNELLCQLTADRTQRTVLAGPVEATAIGNILVQARAAGAISGELKDLRQLVATTFPPRAYSPR